MKHKHNISETNQENVTRLRDVQGLKGSVVQKSEAVRHWCDNMTNYSISVDYYKSKYDSQQNINCIFNIKFRAFAI